MSSVFNGLVLLAFSLVLGMSGAYLTARELAPFDFSFAPDAQLLDRLAQEAPPVPPSIFGTNVSLEICEEAMSGLGFFLSPRAQIEAVAGNCAATAREIGATMPGLAYAPYVEAIAFFALERPDQAAAALIRSQEIGPNEQWIAERRVALAELHYDSLGAYAEAGHLADLELLAQSRRGIRSIASRYVSSADFRERVTAVVETLPSEVQQRFVTLVRREAREQIAGG